MVWGYLQLTGRIDEPFGAGLKRLVTLAVVLGGALHLWLYNTIIVDTIYRAPTELAAALVGSSDPVAAIDAIWERGGAVAGYLWSKRGLSVAGFPYPIAGVIVWALMARFCGYPMVLIGPSKLARADLT